MKPKNIDEYIASFPAEVQAILQQVRATIRAAAPQAEECISYGMPAFKLNGPLVYFAAYKSHIGFYPTGSGIEHFKAELEGYRWSKGAVQFPLGRPIPHELIRRMTEFKVGENMQKAKVIRQRSNLSR
jgi:uncharacterized protein YdhG (YjbR/CyaY superfamily)